MNTDAPANKTDIMKETSFTFLGRKITGKVRDIYDQGDKLVLITTDRHSSFDRIIAHVPWKGQVLNQVSAHWFEATKDIVPNHMLAVPDPNVTVAKKCAMVPVEAVVRGYLTGVTDTAIWTRYGKGERNFGGVTLPDGMRKNQKLPQSIFDPTTKEAAHDRALTPERLADQQAAQGGRARGVKQGGAAQAQQHQRRQLALAAPERERRGYHRDPGAEAQHGALDGQPHEAAVGRLGGAGGHRLLARARAEQQRHRPQPVEQAQQ